MTEPSHQVMAVPSTAMVHVKITWCKVLILTSYNIWHVLIIQWLRSIQTIVVTGCPYIVRGGVLIPLQCKLWSQDNITKIL